MNLNQLVNEIGWESVRMQYGNLPIYLVGALGNKLKTSLVIGDPDKTEVYRKLLAVDFDLKNNALMIKLTLESLDGERTLVIENVTSSQYDKALGINDEIFKFYLNVQIAGKMVVHRMFMETDGEKRGLYQKEHFGSEEMVIKIN